MGSISLTRELELAEYRSRLCLGSNGLPAADAVRVGFVREGSLTNKHAERDWDLKTGELSSRAAADRPLASRIFIYPLPNQKKKPHSEIAAAVTLWFDGRRAGC
jgi:hypothetical protein